MQNQPLDATDLTWLTGLAQALLGDAHAADDLVQETLVAALQRPGPVGIPRRPWLRAVARHLAARRFRGEARRAERERAVAREEALPGSSELVEQAEIAEQVVAATRALPEPFRRTILLRFLEGLEPEEIARREGKPADTVRWRVRRGLELLRAELVSRHDREWRAWCALLVPLARPRAGLGLGASTALVHSLATWTVMKLTTTLLAAVLALTALWLALPPQETTAHDHKTGPALALDGQPAAPAESVDLTTVDPATSRVVVEARTLPVAQVANAGLTGAIVDEGGNGVAGATVLLVPAPAAAGVASGHGGPAFVASTTSTEAGVFRFERKDYELAAVDRDLELGVIANGYLNRRLQGVLESWPETGLTVVLSGGDRLVGRVVDEDGFAVPQLQVLAHPVGAGVGHVSPSRVVARALRARIGGGSAEYQDCIGVTDARGELQLSGLSDGDLELRSLDPGWSIVGPARVRADGRFVEWTAAERLGVALEVFDRRDGKPVESASATFRVELTFLDGEVVDYGQWVGGGAGGASFALDPAMLPPMAGRTIARAGFYGTVKAGSAEVPWAAEPLQSATGARGVATVRLELDPSLAFDEPEGADSEDWVPAPATATLDLDVRTEEGTPFSRRLSVDWRSTPPGALAQEGDASPAHLAPGRYALDVVAGEVELTIREFGASGSLPPWTATVSCHAGQATPVFVTLASGARVSLARPKEWSGEWFVHASWRPPGEADWRGSWNYSTTSQTLELAALRPAEWRFELSDGQTRDPAAVVRTIELADGDSRTLE
ncbi:RNA polymerase sigma factor [Engelhardtia mirabilis]|uniref:ECF RNA polymerase sigma factor SigW n=1 Tax=Engelhardtia mirabilis TaxID=2528011 RepID=A0A518BEM2_9BACT|nr:ECF RNA polymerase sigma factor SigW [Planctomycetes bacterium Pla133]QDU99659.1 ECF RNA polymerase sigma factor SigW [Planctomycetes bacterium Pla86]